MHLRISHRRLSIGSFLLSIISSSCNNIIYYIQSISCGHTHNISDELITCSYLFVTRPWHHTAYNIYVYCILYSNIISTIIPNDLNIHSYMCVIIAFCRCYYRSFELHLAGECVCVGVCLPWVKFSSDIPPWSPSVVQTLLVFLRFGNTIFRTFVPAGDCDFISTVLFYTYSRKSVRITFLYFRTDLYACRCISLDWPVELFL